MRKVTLKEATLAISLFPALQQKLGGIVPSKELLKQVDVELPGGSPFSLCSVSSPTDIFDVRSVELTKQPVYIDDDLYVHIYGAFRQGLSSNATINVTGDCGSHCEMYGRKPGEGSSFSLPFYGMGHIEQPPGGQQKNETVPPEEGFTLITSPIYVWPMFLSTPGWYNFTFDAKTVDGDRIYCLTTEVCLRWEDPKKSEGYPKGPWNDCQWPR